MLNALIRLIASVSCVGIMIGFYYLVRWFVNTVDLELSFGMFCGMMFQTILYYCVWRVDPTCFDRKTPRLKWWHL